MSPKDKTKKFPQPTPSASMESVARRRRSMAADAAADDESTAGAESGAAVVSDAAAVDGADGAAVASSAEKQEDRSELAIIGQELVPVEAKEGEKKLEDEFQKEETSLEKFQTPGGQKPLGSPDQLQLNTMHVKSNEDSEARDETQKNGQLSMVPNGPPVSFGPEGGRQAPLFTPEQIAQATDSRFSSSLLPLTRESTAGADLSRVPGFLQGFFTWVRPLS